MEVNIKDYGDETKSDVVIENEDLWSLDYTLAHIIHPALVAFKKANNGGWTIDNEDLTTEELEKYPHVDDDCFDRTDMILDIMIEGFGLISNGSQFLFENLEVYRENRDKISRATNLFGKYYQNLWT